MPSRKFVRPIATLLFALILACSEKTNEPQHLEFGSAVDIQLGQSLTFEPDQLIVTFIGVNFDLRCPADKQCAWPGIAEIRLEARVSGEDAAFLDLALSGESDTTWESVFGLDTLGYEFTLISLSATSIAIYPPTQMTDSPASATILIRESAHRQPVFSGPSRLSTLNADSIPTTDAEIESATLDGDTLKLTISTNNSCVRHYFELNLQTTPRLESGQPSFALWLRHTQWSASCDSEKKQIDLKFDMGSFFDYVNRAVGLGRIKVFSLYRYVDTGVHEPPGFEFAYWGPENENNTPPVFYETNVEPFRFGQRVAFEVRARDPENVTLILSVVNMPEGGSFADLGTGIGNFEWSPSVSQVGEHEIRFVAHDGYLSDTLIILIAINPNSRPEVGSIFPNDTLEVMAGGYEIASFDVVDPDSDRLEIEVIRGTPGLHISWRADRSGVNVGIPAQGPVGTFRDIWVAVTDGVLSDTAKITLSIIQYLNSPPRFTARDTSLSLNEGSTSYLSLIALDDSRDSLEYWALGLPTNWRLREINNHSVELQISPSYRQHDTYLVKVVVSDGSLFDTASVRITVIDISVPPVLDHIADRVSLVGSTSTIELVGLDPDGDVLTFSMSSAPQGATLVPTSDTTAQFIHICSEADRGEHRITFYVSDGSYVDSQETVLAIVELNAGTNSIIPFNAGNYWIYGPGFYSSTPGDSLAVVGSARDQDTLWWYLNHDFPPLSHKVRLSGDTLFSTFGIEFVSPSAEGISFPVRVHAEHSFNTDRRATLMTNPVTVPAGTFYGCIKYTASNPNLCYNYLHGVWMGIYSEEYIIAPGVGIISYTHWFKYECTFNTEFVSGRRLLRYYLNPN